jgi:hypothetical protein
MTARTTLLCLLRTHEGAARVEPVAAIDTAEKHLRAHPDGVEAGEARGGLRASSRGMPEAYASKRKFPESGASGSALRAWVRLAGGTMPAWTSTSGAVGFTR